VTSIVTSSRSTQKEPRSESFRERRRAREASLQMLYECEVGGLEADEAIAVHDAIEQAARLTTPEAREFAARLVIGTRRSVEEIDPIIADAAEHWRPERMAIVDRLILRLAVYQMLHVPDVPPIVVIDEAVELARSYGGDESGRFVNGVLDAIRKKLTSQLSANREPKA
jgi:transcription antitermination protein NusB